MIKKFNGEFDFLEYIGNNYNRCLYLYMDYKKYGYKDDSVKVYYQIINNKVCMICLNYSTSLHIYSQDMSCNFDELAEFITNNNYKAVFAEKKLIEKLESLLLNYKSEYGFVRHIKSSNIELDGAVEIAKEDDLDEITDLVMIDKDIATSYSRDDLYLQLKNRLKQGFGRNYIIRKENKIVAHISTNGEIDRFAMVALLIVHPEYRRMGLATKVMNKMVSDLHTENKEAFLINYTEESSALYDKLGFEKSCEWGKLFFID